MTDLVEKVAAVRRKYARRPREEQDRAVIAAVLGDLASVEFVRGLTFQQRELWLAMLAAKRSELGLSSPEGPGDAPKRPVG